MLENWRPVPGYEGHYEVSDLGHIRSLDRITDKGRRWRGRMMTGSPMANGYLVVSLWRWGRQSNHLLHRLILAAFVGPAPDGAETRHMDGDKTNNALPNLAWGTHAENQADQVRHGTHSHASKTHCLRGHAYDQANTYAYPGRTKRACRACRSEYARNDKRRAAA